MASDEPKTTREAEESAEATLRDCPICRFVPDRASASWKGGEPLSGPLPAAVMRLQVVGAPFFDTGTTHSHGCLLQCSKCGTYFAWEYHFEHSVDSAEEEVTLRRLSLETGRKRAMVILRYIEKTVTQFDEQVPTHLEALLHAPRRPARIEEAARFFLESGRNGCEIQPAIPALVFALGRVSRKRDAFITLVSALSVFASQNRKNLGLLRETLRPSGLLADSYVSAVLTGCENAMRTNCPICRGIPDSVSTLMGAEDYPPTCDQLEDLASQIKRCPRCWGCYYAEWDELPYVNNFGPGIRLYRLNLEQIDILALFLEKPDRKILDELAFYLGQMQLTGFDLTGRVDAILVALLCTFTSNNSTLRRLAYRSLERFAMAGPEKAGHLLALLERYGELTWRTRIDKTAPEIQGVVWKCEAVLSRRPASRRETNGPRAQASRIPSVCLYCGATLRPEETVCRACLPSAATEEGAEKRP